ncbi:N-acetylmuramoyl-L-alanine amidase [Nocardioides alcanivorans]|uniref:N-acetylmuramoyl-L-alanine amidase n=1 Tax=Nocardioides alcanivorans TaxID=2897352 RepID=UPI001F2074EA|nr:N-acetylmuramoyl-L-alanine amidase [Nocardioides alcanivorans]
MIAPPGADELALAADGSGVAALDLPVGTAAQGPAARRSLSSSDVQVLDAWDTETFSQVAVTWQGAAGDVEVRTRSNGQWTGWQELEPLGDGPDGPEASKRQGSDLVWVGDSDGVQLRATGAIPDDLRLVLQRPELETTTVARTAANSTETPPVVNAANTNANNTTTNTAAPAKRTKVPRPGLLKKRKAWGPNNKWRNGKPTFNTSLNQVHIHHTASSNDYTKAEVPGIIRGMMRYHTQTLGWFDIGYNFLVDKYGGMWVGRSGGAGKLVRGAHTLGFNNDSTGIAVIGNFETATPTKQMLVKIARIAAWKLDRHNAPKAKGKVTVTSTGSDRYKAGTKVKLPAIDGHRDTNQTACPGAQLYDRLGKIRNRAQKRLNKFRS